MQNDIPKPFLMVADLLIIQHTVKRFTMLSDLIQVIVSTSKDFTGQAGLVEQMLPDHVGFRVTQGGRERQDSIYNALQLVDPNTELIAIHDAVRPFVSQETIRNCLKAAREGGAAIAGIPAQDTVKVTDRNNRIVDTPDRSMLWNAQTPQVFQKKVILQAYEKAHKKHFKGTDDASLVEENGGTVLMIRGNRENFKITYPVDLQLAELLLNRDR